MTTATASFSKEGAHYSLGKEEFWQTLTKSVLLNEVALRLGELTPSEMRTLHSCWILLYSGVFPTPTRLNRVLHGAPHRRTINGREARIRTTFLELEGYRSVDIGPHGATRWWRKGGPNPHPWMEGDWYPPTYRTFQRLDGTTRRERITDYHAFTDIDTSAEERERLGVGDVYVNAATCGRCGDTPRSCNRHDMVSCKCGDISVDGGSWYCRMVFKDGATWTSASVMYNDVKEEP